MLTFCVYIDEIASALFDGECEVAVANDALNGLKSTYELYPDLIIMDRDLPMVSAQEPCSRLKQVVYRPIIVIGKQSNSAEILELGADAYMKIPLDLEELIAKIKSLLHRAKQDDPPKGKTSLEREAQKQEGGIPEGLTPTEFRLASCLMLNKGRVLDYMHLISEVWGGKKITLDTLHFYMRRLKQKLVNGNLSILRGVGYCLSDSSPLGTK